MSLDRKRTWGRFSKEKDGNSSESEDDIKRALKKSPSTDSSDEDQTYGPPLPANLLKPKPNTNVVEKTNKTPLQQVKVPVKQPNEKLVIGPILPPHFLQNKTEESCEEESCFIEPVAPIENSIVDNENNSNAECSKDGDNDKEGPMLPPHLLKKLTTMDQQQTIGPETPVDFLNASGSLDGARGINVHAQPEPTASRRILGPELPPGLKPADSSSDDEDEVIGPDPRLMTSEGHSGGSDINERAERARRKLLGLDKEEKKERESWMLELPPERAANIGLGPRQFRQKLAPDLGDRTVWTDTPSDTIRKQNRPPKQDNKDILRQKELADRDRMMEKLKKKAEKHKRKESLLEMHTKKMKEAKKEKDANQPPERKRFNREEDMQVNRFDEAQKKAIFKRAQLLNDRFSSGESKYL